VTVTTDCNLRAILDQLEALDHMELIGMRRAVIVDVRPIANPDGIDGKFVGLVVAD
jgi:hypothetical protein